MTEKFVLWNEDKNCYLRANCPKIDIIKGKAKTTPSLKDAEVLLEYDRAKEYMHALNVSTMKYFYDGSPWGVVNVCFTDYFCTAQEAAAAIESQRENLRKVMSTTFAEDAGEPEEDDDDDKETVTSNHDRGFLDDDKETVTTNHDRRFLDDDKETVTTNHDRRFLDDDKAIKPSHYAQGAGGAAFDVIEALYQVLPWEQFKGFMKGNIMKYTVRYDAKNGTEDVEKAAEYNRRLMAYELREGAKNAD